MGSAALGSRLPGESVLKASARQSQSLSMLDTELLKSPRRFGFVKATELLEKSADGAAAVGFAHPPEQEVVRFRAVPSLGFPAADIDSARQLANGLIELQVNFMGLYGPSSPLPAYFTEAVIEEDVSIANQEARHYFLSTKGQVREYQSQRIDVTHFEAAASHIRKQIRARTLDVIRLNDGQMKTLKDGADLSAILTTSELAQFADRQLVLEVAEKAASRQRDFLDLFNHRLISLYYRAARKYQPYRDYGSGGTDAFSEKVYALMGAPQAAQRQKSALQWPRLLHFAGLLAMKQASKERIIKVLGGYFGLSNVTVEEGVLRLVDIPPDQRCALGSRNMIIGEDFMLGSRVADRCGKFRVFLGQLSLETFNAFLPASTGADHAMGKYYLALNELLQFIKPSELLCDIELELCAAAVPQFTLGRQSVCHLGWSTWLGDSPGQSRSVIIPKYEYNNKE